MRDEQQQSEKEKQISDLLVAVLSGTVRSFPDTAQKLRNTAQAWAKFVSLEEHHVVYDPAIEPFVTAEERQRVAWKEGIIPGEWLAEKIRDECEFMPAPVVARRMYCEGGFRPLDGKAPPAAGDVRPADNE